MLSKKQSEKYMCFYNSALYNNELDYKTTLLIHLAVSMSIGCSP